MDKLICFLLNCEFKVFCGPSHSHNNYCGNEAAQSFESLTLQIKPQCVNMLRNVCLNLHRQTESRKRKQPHWGNYDMINSRSVVNKSIFKHLIKTVRCVFTYITHILSELIQYLNRVKVVIYRWMINGKKCNKVMKWNMNLCATYLHIDPPTEKQWITKVWTKCAVWVSSHLMQWLLGYIIC